MREQARVAIPHDQWIWDGHPGHNIIADQCRFHLHTRVGDFIVSTIGEYERSNRNERTNGKDLGGPDYAPFHSVGAGRLFETFVFKANLQDRKDVTPSEWMEIDAEPANDHDTANKNHMAMCEKYSYKRLVVKPVLPTEAFDVVDA